MAELGLDGGCHAKGFSQRLDWGDAETEDLARAFGREMERGDVVVWDGDDYAEDSFTKVLAGLPENVRLVAVRCRVHVDAFVESWSGIAEQNQRTIVCVAVEDMDETTKGPEGSLGWWEELGVLALQATQVKRVVCLGGGVCVEHEARRAPPDVTFQAFRAKRRGQERPGAEVALWETTALGNVPSVTWLETERSLHDAYQLGESVGEGGFGTVYAAVDRASGVARAVKVLARDTLNTFETVSIEIAVMKAIAEYGEGRGVHLLPLVECFDTRASVALVCPILTGGDLVSRIPDDCDTMSEYDTACATHALCDALAALHALGVVHRDVKPDNMVFESDQPGAPLKLIDYGCALITKGSAREIEADARGMVIGTAEFAAPEVLKSQEYSAACDVFGVGVMTYALLCGELPFMNEVQTIFCEVSVDGPGWETISEEAKDFVRGCLQKKPLRMTVNDCLRHPWLKSGGRSETLNRYVSFRSKAPRSAKSLRGMRLFATTTRGLISLNRIRAGYARLAGVLANCGFTEEECLAACAAILQMFEVALKEGLGPLRGLYVLDADGRLKENGPMTHVESERLSRERFVEGMGKMAPDFDANMLFDELAAAKGTAQLDLTELAGHASHYGAGLRWKALLEKKRPRTGAEVAAAA